MSSDWRHEAACLTEDPELFFPIGTTGPAVVQVEMAKAVCGRCTVVEDCLREALDTRQDAGVWGGLSEDERRSLARRMARERRAALAAPDPEASTTPEAATVPAVATAYVIDVWRQAGVSWRDIGQRLGTSDGTCREVHTGTRQNVARATEDRALAAEKALVALVDA